MSNTASGCPGRYSRRPSGGHRLRGQTSRYWAAGWRGLSKFSTSPNSYVPAAPEGLAALSFLADDYRTMQDRARQFTSDVTVLDTGVPGVDLFICTMGGVPMEFMGSYEAQAMEALTRRHE